MLTPGSTWFARWLYRATLTVATGLALFVLGAPLLEPQPRGDGWERICYLFAEDVTVRRISIAAALGLWITAVVFFRHSRPTPVQPEAPS